MEPRSSGPAFVAQFERILWAFGKADVSLEGKKKKKIRFIF